MQSVFLFFIIYNNKNTGLLQSVQWTRQNTVNFFYQMFVEYRYLNPVTPRCFIIDKLNRLALSRVKYETAISRAITRGLYVDTTYCIVMRWCGYYEIRVDNRCILLVNSFSWSYFCPSFLLGRWGGGWYHFRKEGSHKRGDGLQKVEHIYICTNWVVC